jgi:hypothetical protein
MVIFQYFWRWHESHFSAKLEIYKYILAKILWLRWIFWCLVLGDVVRKSMTTQSLSLNLELEPLGRNEQHAQWISLHSIHILSPPPLPLESRNPVVASHWLGYWTWDSRLPLPLIAGEWLWRSPLSKRPRDACESQLAIALYRTCNCVEEIPRL